MSRTDKALKNILYALGGQGIGLFVSFISRAVFIHTLGTEYLGVNGLFSNILTVLSFAELGIGAAIVYCLYEPLAHKNTEKIKTLMHLYKVVYRYIALAVFALGLIITPFVEVFIKDVPDVSNLKLIFVLFVINSSVSYLFSYKRSLIIADQNRYIATVYRYGFYCILNVLQIIFLYVTHNYIVYLCLLIANTLLENVCVSAKADKLYPFLKEKNVSSLDLKTKETIVKNVKAMILHKSGGIVVNSTDNIIISKTIGLVSVGLYSNYLLVINAMNTIFGLLFQSITAGVGELNVLEDKRNVVLVFKRVLFANFLIYGSFAVWFSNVINPFISLWVGTEYLLSSFVVTILAVNFYLSGMRKSALTFREALGLYWYDRYKPIFESVINLVCSIILAKYMGLSGVFLGTMISTLTTCSWVEPYMLYKYGFKTSVVPYFYKFAFYFVVLLIVEGATSFFCSLINCEGITRIIVNTIISLVCFILITVIIYSRSQELKYFVNLLKTYFKKCFGKTFKGVKNE